MLDEGKDLDWFSSDEIRVLAVVAVIGFFSFLIWELTEEHPIVDLRVFRHRGFAASMFVLALAFGAFFGLNVLTPLWLQYNMGYTTTWAGLVVAWGGLLSVVFSPIAANLANRFDPRWLVFIGCFWLGGDTLWRAVATSDMDYWSICIPMFFMGVGMPMYYVPITGLGHGLGGGRGNGLGRRTDEFRAHDLRRLRHLPGDDLLAGQELHRPRQARRCRGPDRRSGRIDASSGSSGQLVREMLDDLVTGESLMLATNGLMMVIGAVFIIASVSIVLAPRASRAVNPASVGH